MRREPPSREANPFATCWTRPGALPYEPVSTPVVAAVIERLRRFGWYGQVVGRHGAGKSTLLEALVEPLRHEGIEPIRWDAAQGASMARPGELLLVEGFERLPMRLAIGHLIRWRRAGQAFLVTTHAAPLAMRLAVPVVCRMEPEVALLRRLFERLTARRPTRVTMAQAEESFTRHRGNLREVWFDLYDLHEAHRPLGRTTPVVASYV